MEAKDIKEENMGTAYDNGWHNGRRVGIREVVEWIKEQQYECGNPDDMAYHWLLIPPEDWQAKRKEWGIE